MIRQRHILYVEGYDPQGAEGYYGIFRRQWPRFLKIWPVTGSVGALQCDSDDLAHWDIEAAGPNWRVRTRYEFLRQEAMIRTQMARPSWKIVLRALCWMLDYYLSGTMIRIARASHQYALALLFFHLMLLAWIAAAAAAGWMAGWAVSVVAGLPPVWSVGLGAVVAAVALGLLRPVAQYFFAVQINSHWPLMLDHVRGRPSPFDHAIETGARRLIEIVHAGGADEVVLIGHSGGGLTAPAIMARALECDPGLGRHGPCVVLLTLGSILPGVALHRGTIRAREIVRRLAEEPSVRWIDVQSRKDVLNFWDFDPVGGLRLDLAGERHNPFVWRVRFRDMLNPKFYRKLRNNYFRMHYQFLMANDMRAYYDYFMLVCGPASAVAWARDGWVMVARFSANMTYAADADEPLSEPLPPAG